MAIIITGSVGTGKTTLAKALSKMLKMDYIDVNSIIKEHKLCEEYDKERMCMIIDEHKLAKILARLIKANDKVIIDSHMSHFISPQHVDLCIVTQCDLKTLERRLKKRGYSKKKIAENLEAEIFDTCLHEAKEGGHQVLVVDTTRRIRTTELARQVKTLIS